VNLRISSFSVKKRLLKGSVEKLSFSMPDEGFALKEGAGKVFITDQRAEVINLKAVSSKAEPRYLCRLTESTFLRLTAQKLSPEEHRS